MDGCLGGSKAMHVKRLRLVLRVARALAAFLLRFSGKSRSNPMGCFGLEVVVELVTWK